MKCTGSRSLKHMDGRYRNRQSEIHLVIVKLDSETDKRM